MQQANVRNMTKGCNYSSLELKRPTRVHKTYNKIKQLINAHQKLEQQEIIS